MTDCRKKLHETQHLCVVRDIGGGACRTYFSTDAVDVILDVKKTQSRDKKVAADWSTCAAMNISRRV